MAFDAKDYPISTILTRTVFDIPRNQRRYVWKKEQWDALFDDIIFSIAQDNKPHFIGSIVLDGGEIKDGLYYYTIIDGQQRITTIILFLVAIMKHFQEKDMEDDFLGTVSYLRSKNDRNKDEYTINSDYHLSLKALVKGIIEDSDKKESISAFVETHILFKSRDKVLGDAIKHFYSRIKDDLDKNEDPEKRTRDIRAALLNMMAVKIVSSTEEDAYTIFEILNARGQALESHELLKNYIMRYIQPAERRDDAKGKWEDLERTIGSAMNRFVKHYATHRFGTTTEKYTLPYQTIQKATKGQDIGALFDDIKLKSEYYAKLINPSKGEGGNCTEEEFRVFDFFRKKRFEQFRPVLLSLIHQKNKEKITDEDYMLALKYVYNFFVCYSIIGEEKSNKLEDTVFKYAPLLENNYSKQVLQEFANSLKSRLPGYEWFLNSFKNIGWSNHYDLYKGEKNKDRVQIVLEVIEEFVSQSHVVTDYTIEHILPDSQSIENSQIGNMIPLEEPLNRQVGDKDIVEKYEIYKQSGFASARNFATRYQDMEFKPSQRTEFMAKMIFNNVLELDQFGFETKGKNRTKG